MTCILHLQQHLSHLRGSSQCLCFAQGGADMPCRTRRILHSTPIFNDVLAATSSCGLFVFWVLFKQDEPSQMAPKNPSVVPALHIMLAQAQVRTSNEEVQCLNSKLEAGWGSMLQRTLRCCAMSCIMLFSHEVYHLAARIRMRYVTQNMLYGSLKHCVVFDMLHHCYLLLKNQAPSIVHQMTRDPMLRCILRPLTRQQRQSWGTRLSSARKRSGFFGGSRRLGCMK